MRGRLNQKKILKDAVLYCIIHFLWFSTSQLTSFLQWLSSLLLHLHAFVQGSPTFWQLHFESTVSGTDARDINLGTILES